MTLHELAVKYGSDKAEHGYCPFYEQYLPKNPKKLLEIGVKEGASIRMWKDWFPETQIFGLDLFEEFPIPNIEGVQFYKGNQVDHLLLEQLRKEDFDIIIDDGSHLSRHQMMTFFGLFNGKHYFIEDLHASREDFYLQDLPDSFSASCIFGDIKKYHKNTFEEYPNLYTEPHSIKFDQDTKIVCIHAAKSNQPH